MAKTTQVKIFFLLLAYSTVLFHSAIPHCHANDIHTFTIEHESAHHLCDDHHSDQEHSEPHEHQVCHIDDLHGDYLKSESDYSFHANLFIPELLPVLGLCPLFDIGANSLSTPPELTLLTKDWRVKSNILRGPPIDIAC